MATVTEDFWAPDHRGTTVTSRPTDFRFTSVNVGGVMPRMVEDEATTDLSVAPDRSRITASPGPGAAIAEFEPISGPSPGPGAAIAEYVSGHPEMWMDGPGLPIVRTTPNCESRRARAPRKSVRRSRGTSRARRSVRRRASSATSGRGDPDAHRPGRARHLAAGRPT